MHWGVKDNTKNGGSEASTCHFNVHPLIQPSIMNLSSSTSLRRRSSSFIALTAVMLFLLIICSFCTLSLVDAKTPLLSSVTSSTRSALKPSLVHQKSSNIDGSTNNSVPTSSSNGLTHIPSFLQRRKRVTSYS